MFYFLKVFRFANETTPEIYTKKMFCKHVNKRYKLRKRLKTPELIKFATTPSDVQVETDDYKFLTTSKSKSVKLVYYCQQHC